MITSEFDILRILLSISMFSIAIFLDIKKREIDDRLWIAFGGVSLLLAFVTPNTMLFLKTLAFSAMIIPLSIVIWRIGLFGGADAFLLIVLSCLSPLSSFSSSTITPFTTFTNGVMLLIIPILFNVIRNTCSLLKHKNIFQGFEHESRKKKIFAFMIGHRSKNPRFSFSIETTGTNGKRLDLKLKNADNEKFCESQDIWVTQGLPFMIYLFGGYVIQVLYGDVLFNIFRIL